MNYELPTQNSKSAGFTLIELLITITIISILIAVGTLSWTMSQKKGRDGKRKSDLKTIQQALEDYYRTNLYYTGNSSDPSAAWCGVINGSNTQVKDALVSGGYLQSIPSDPNASSDYILNKTDRNHYALYAKLESTSDPDASVTYNVDCVANYNYKVTSP